MASEFSIETPVVRYQLRAHVKPGPRRYLLWPAYAYRVLAPRIRRREINVFQKAMLGLGRAGVVFVEDQAACLHIHPDLAEFIFTQLQERGYTENRNITDKGRLALRNEEWIDDDQLVSGFVFRDPWSGEIWPRFVESLELDKLELNDQGHPCLVSGTKGEPIVDSALMVLPGYTRVLPHTPTADEVLWAAETHARASRLKDQAGLFEESFGKEAWMTPVRLGKVSLIQEEPMCVFLATYVYVPHPETGVEFDGWHVCDPFGLGASQRLRRAIEKQTGEDPKIRAYIDTFVKNATGQTAEEYNSSLREFEARALNEVYEKCLLRETAHPLFESLLAMERAHQEAEQLGDNCRPEKKEIILILAGKALERLFLLLREQYPTQRVWRIIDTEDKAYRVSLINRLAHEMEYQVPLPDSLAGVHPNKIRSAADYGTGTLGSHILAALLAARQVESHPLRMAATQVPDLLIRLGELANERGLSAHDNDQWLTLDDINRHLQTVYDSVRVLATPQPQTQG